MHCVLSHWSARSVENRVAMSGWLRQWQSLGKEEIGIVVGSMMRSSRPFEGAAFILASSLFPEDADIREFAKNRLIRFVGPNLIDCVYALGPQLDCSERLAEWLAIKLIEFKKFVGSEGTREAIKDVLFIWSSGEGRGICSSCGKILMSPSTLKRAG